ncbi:cytochrome P450 [Microterricola viridarii]|uniref:cytochrome P450 n=1 Tax=Microterricola viridarii TaxID=412690 RepID=UPI0009E9BEB0|nr:cytochrome P450 [Microterricola viridarii]
MAAESATTTETTAAASAAVGAGGTLGESVDLAEMWVNPWPLLERLRAEEPVAWVPAANRYLVTRYDDVSTIEQNPEIFIAREEGSLMYRVMGHPFLRKDGEEHRAERHAVESPLKPNAIKRHWNPIFERNAADLIDALEQRGGGELVADFFGPLAARNLAHVLGFMTDTSGHAPDAFDLSLQVWSQSMMDGVGNYADDPAVWAQADAVVAEIDAEIDRAVARVRVTPDESMISAAVHAEYQMPIESLRAAVKMTIGGGVNEPRDAMGIAVYALITHPEIRARVEADAALWRPVFEETIRWVAPISMYPKMVAVDTELGGVSLKPGDKIGVCVGSANRDERVFERPEEFNIDRDHVSHHAFGGGPHFCGGAWVARASVAQIALPELFRRLPGLQLAPGAAPRERGWVFRGLLELPAVW